MAQDITTYSPLNLQAGSAPLRSLRVTIPAAHAAIPALTPVKYDVNFKIVPATALTDEVVGVTIPGAGSQEGALIGTTVDAADQFAHIYTHGDLFGDMVDFTAMATANSDLKKSSVFAKSGINLTFPAAGQV